MKTDLAIVSETENLPRIPVARASLAPTTFGEMMRFSEMLAGSTLVPKDFVGKPQNVLVAIQWGMEIGLAPMQALQNIAVINGRPSLWGDAALAVVQNHPAYEWHKEYTEGEGDALVGVFEIKRRGNDVHRATFSATDAKKAGLWGKAGPWTQYTKRMVCLRARGFGLRDKFADALKGLITAEEARDYPVENPPLMTTDMHGNLRPLPERTSEPAKVVHAKKAKAAERIVEDVFIENIVNKSTANGAPYLIVNGLHGESYFVFDKGFFATAEANRGRTLKLGVSIDSKGRKSIVGGLEPIEDVETELTRQLKESLAETSPATNENGDRVMF